ncbi:MAG: DUF6790 family protein [Terriglobia bacterium]
MFLYLLAAVLVAASIHVVRLDERTTQRIGEIALLYLLVGYCGVPMLAVSVVSLVSPEQAALHLGFPAGNPFQEFLGYALLGMALLSLLALRYRRTFLIAPAICWSVFFAGATFIHLKDYGERGALTHGNMIHIFASHGLISLLLVVALFSSGLLKENP